MTIENLYPVSKTRPETDCGLLIEKFRLMLNTEGKNLRSLRYDLKQIPYDYIVEVMNRFKGSDLVDRVPEALWTEICNMQEAVRKLSPRKRNS